MSSQISPPTLPVAPRSLPSSLASELDASVTAGGVETVPELDAFTLLGVDHAQGYLLARPSTDPRRWHTWHRRDWQPTRWHRTRIQPDLAKQTPDPRIAAGPA